MLNILVTGATGFVGAALIEQLLMDNYQVTALVRNSAPTLPPNVKQIVTGSFETFFPASSICRDTVQRTNQDSGVSISVPEIFKDVDVVVHAAARAHIMIDNVADPLAEYKKVNTVATLALAREAAKAGVRRFIFISTIKVYGESTELGKPLSEQSNVEPKDPYSISKWEAERGLTQIADETSMEVVIIRPPLIYGPGVKGNFARMMRWVGYGIPLPLGAINNQRSLLALDNLLSFIECCFEHPKAANEVFILSDFEDLSTTELIRKLADAEGTKARLFPAPASLMKFVATMLGKRDIAARLFSSLQVSSTKARQQLGWQHVISIEEQLRKMVDSHHV